MKCTAQELPEAIAAARRQMAGGQPLTNDRRPVVYAGRLKHDPQHYRVGWAYQPRGRRVGDSVSGLSLPVLSIYAETPVIVWAEGEPCSAST